MYLRQRTTKLQNRSIGWNKEIKSTMILNEFFYKYLNLRTLVRYRLSYIAITRWWQQCNQWLSRKISRMKMAVSVNIVNVIYRTSTEWTVSFEQVQFLRIATSRHRLVLMTDDETQLKKDNSWGWKNYWILTRFFLAWYLNMMSNIQKLYILVWNPWETPLSKSFKVVRYFSSKERELKVRTWLKLSSKISANIKLRRGPRSGVERKTWWKQESATEGVAGQ